VDRPARPKDDLFDNSTMSFGEHLDELRISIGKALLWLAIGLVLGLAFFANRVVRYVQEPLKTAIQQFNADRDLARLGYDPASEDVAPLRKLLSENGLMWELVYDVPDDLMKHFAPAPAEPTAEPTADPTLPASPLAGPQTLPVGPIKMVDLLSKLPSPEKLTPRLQLRRHEIGLSALKIEEPFMIWFKAGLIVGAVIASPMVFYHLWTFVAAGLHQHERRYVYTFLPISVGLFVSGVVLAFFFVLHYVLQFLLTFNGQLEVAVEPRLSYYINFVLLLPLGFGLAFQLPLVMFVLERIGLISVEAYMSSWRVAILVIAVISMLVTPADVTSMLSLMIPLVFLYFLGIAMCKYMPKGRGLGSDAYDPA
jgi:sec-independent protein translocase protein TatC